MANKFSNISELRVIITQTAESPTAKRNYEPQLPEHLLLYETVPQLRLLVACFPPRRPGVEPRSRHMGFVVHKVAMGQVFSEYFGFPCQFPFHLLLHTHHLSSGAGTIGHLMADVPSGLSLTLLQERKEI
jgi:hypothetical protein